MIVEELVSKLGLEISPDALSVLEKFRSAVTGGLAGMAAGAAALTAAFAGTVTSAALAADEIGDLAEKLGVDATKLQELKFAAEQSDVSFESLSTGLKFISKNAIEAAQGSEELQKAFAGIRTRDANGQVKSADDLLLSVGEKLRALPAGAEQTALAIKLLGRSGADLVPLLKKSDAELQQFIADAHDLGVVLDKESIEAAGEFDRQLKRLKQAFLGLRNEFSAPFFQAFADGMKAAVDVIKSLRPAFKNLAKMFNDLGQRFKGLGKLLIAPFVALVDYLSKTFIGKLFGSMDMLKLLEGLFIGLGVAATLMAVKTAAAWLIAAGPFLLLAALIGFIADEIYSYIDGQDTLIKDFEDLKKAIGDPKAHPLIRMLNFAFELISKINEILNPLLLLPKVYEAFRDRNDKTAPTQEEIDAFGKARRFKETGIPEYDQGGIFGQGGLLDKIGLKRSGFSAVPASKLPADFTPTSAADGVPLQGPPRNAGTLPPISITINGADMDKETMKQVATESIQKVLQDAEPALAGG